MIKFLQGQVAELQKQLIALSDRGSYRDLYPKMIQETRESIQKAAADFRPADPRRLTYTPKVTVAEVAEQVQRKMEKES